MIFLLRLFTPSEWKKLTTNQKLALIGYMLPIISAIFYVVCLVIAYLNNFSDVKPYSEPILKVQKIENVYQFHVLHGFKNEENASGFVDPFTLEIVDAITYQTLSVFNTSDFVKLEIKPSYIDIDILFNQKNETNPFIFEANRKYLLRLKYNINDKRRFSSGYKHPVKLYLFEISKQKMMQLIQSEKTSSLVKIYLNEWTPVKYSL